MIFGKPIWNIMSSDWLKIYICLYLCVVKLTDTNSHLDSEEKREGEGAEDDEDTGDGEKKWTETRALLAGGCKHRLLDRVLWPELATFRTIFHFIFVSVLQQIK